MGTERVKWLGATFGRLRVLGDSGRRSLRKTVWNCLCDPLLGGCGKHCQVAAYNLRSGNTRSCGCLRFERAKDLVGLTFGRLRVLRDSGERCLGSVVWECLCDPLLGGCGNVCRVKAGSLKRKKKKSCGCLRREVEVSAKLHEGMGQPPAGKPYWHTVADAAEAMAVNHMTIRRAARCAGARRFLMRQSRHGVKQFLKRQAKGMVELWKNSGDSRGSSGYLPYSE